MKNYTFELFLTAAIFASICFCRASSLAFLLSLNFLFTWGYYISTWAEIVSTRVEIFHTIAIFFNLVYRVDIWTRDENLHIISPLDNNGIIVDLTDDNNTVMFKFENKIPSQTGNNGTNNVTIVVLLKHLRKLWRTLGMPLTNCEISLMLTWSANCYII